MANEPKQMIFLTEQLNDESTRLAVSLDAAGYAFLPVVINYDGFLPEGAVSPYGYFVSGGKERQGKPLYFDRLERPALWEIESSNSGGELYEYEQLRARLFYVEPKEKRFIRIVDWLGKDGKVRFSEHYDKYGCRFARTVLNREQKPVHKSYFDEQGREVITENLLTGTIILSWKGKECFFKTKSDFVVFYFEQCGVTIDRIAINSLSVPFFAAEKLRQKHPALTRNLLFWQEPIGDDIPGNMKAILTSGTGGVETIIVQRPDAADRIASLPVDQSRFARLGYIYDIDGENAAAPEALVFTNSDNIEKLDELTKRLPEVHFHIGAITEMSPRLMAFDRRKNVTLYPIIPDKKVEALRKQCDFYLDINNGGEILSAVRHAFLDNQVILSFQQTVHNRRFVAPENIFKSDEWEKLAERLQALAGNADAVRDALASQQRHANSSEPEDYRAVIQ